ncbi:MAG: M48 family metallopeptidase [Pseudomonadota bacterium]
MNFYEHQALAKKQTKRLIFLFAAALLGLILLTALLFAGIAYFFGLYNARLSAYESEQSLWTMAAVVFNGPYLFTISACVLIVVALAAWFRTWQLKSGGQVIAEQLGGRLLNTNPNSFAEKRLLNIVEEMAIASGVTMPSVYLIDEPGINAFAAGYRSIDAVIGVTQGAVEALSRAEMQAVIAHEFSHILNGDMRLNLRLIGFIFGIMAIATLGRYCLRGHYYSRFRRDSRGTAVVFSIGLMLMILGYLGVFFGNLIKAAISRQREFLADASAVQFTRSQQGIVNALRKIGGAGNQQQWQQHQADEVSHMLFSQGLGFHFLSGLLATHPPLDKRIQRLDPQWDGQFLFQNSTAVTASDASTASMVEDNAGLSGFAANGVNSGVNGVLNEGASNSVDDAIENLLQAVEHSGEMTDQQMDYAAQQHAHLAQGFSSLCDAIHEPYAARALVFAMLLDGADSIRQQQWQDLSDRQPPPLLAETQGLYQQLASLSPSQPMILLNLALPVLKQLSEAQYKSFNQQMQRLIKADKKVELREWALFYLIDYYCRSEHYRDRAITQFRLDQRRPALARLLSATVSLGEPSPQQAQALFHAIADQALKIKLRWYAPDEQSIQALTQALKTIRSLRPLEKPRFLKACIKAIESDNKIGRSELEMVHCIAQAMDCPLPVIFGEEYTQAVG